ncbi:MAG: phage tail protein [Bacteroidetes bacterium]|nr:phage tail protein [Bacteroidota bacterium]
MNHFGLVTEGESDQVVVERILMGYFNDPDLMVTANHPLRDETDKGKATGGWGNLLEYLKSDAFKQTFQTTKYIVVQIDTDKSEEFGVSKPFEGKDINIDLLVHETQAKLIESIGEFFELVKQRLIFAISVHEIECWLLPIYYTDSKSAKTTGCINTLNQALQKKEGFSIHAKEYKYYEKMAKNFLKRKDLDRYSPHNPSLKIFVDKLQYCQIEGI